MKIKGNFREKLPKRKKNEVLCLEISFSWPENSPSLPLWLWKLMQCYIYILNVKWRKKINNRGHNFQTKRKRKWNIIKLYKQRGKSIKFNAAHLSTYFWTHKVCSSGMHQVYCMCYKSFTSLEIWSIIRSTEEYHSASVIMLLAFFQTWVLTSSLRAWDPCFSQQYSKGTEWTQGQCS